jgi:hypothetical protein
MKVNSFPFYDLGLMISFFLPCPCSLFVLTGLFITRIITTTQSVSFYGWENIRSPLRVHFFKTSILTAFLLHDLLNKDVSREFINLVVNGKGEKMENDSNLKKTAS